MTARDRFLATLRDGRAGCAPRYERPVAEEVLEAWRGEGFTGDPTEVFRLDRWQTAGAGGAGFDIGAQPPLRRVVRAPLDVPPWLAAHQPEGRSAADWDAQVDAISERTEPFGIQVFRGLFLTFGVQKGDDRWTSLYFLHDYPADLHRMLDHLAAMVTALLGRLLTRVTPDYLLFGETVASSRHAVIGRTRFREYLAPYYRAVIDAGRAGGVPVFIWETYGRATPLLDAVLETGINTLWIGHAREAGIDYLALRRELDPAIGLIGGIDARTLHGPPEGIDREVMRMCNGLLPTGRWAPLLDDRCRPGLPFAGFSHYRACLDRALGE